MNNNLTEKPKQSNRKTLPHLQILDSTVRASAELSTAAFRVYIILRFHHHRKTGTCNPSVPTIMKETNLSKKTVERALNELESAGWLFRKTGMGKKANSYGFPAEALTITLDNPPSPKDAAAANAPAAPQATDAPSESPSESQSEYLARKQREYPQHNVKIVYEKWINFCSEKGLKPTRRYFDKWISEEHEEMFIDRTEVEFEDEESVFKPFKPMSDEDDAYFSQFEFGDRDLK
jgi:hypothetical protein